MTMQQYQIVLCRVSDRHLTIEELALHTGMHPALVEQLVEFGLITPISQQGQRLFEPAAVSRLQSIARLRRSLGVNLTGVSIVLNLVDKVRALQRENQTLRSRG